MGKGMKRAIPLLLAVSLLAACEEEPIIFEGEERPVHEVEDILGDRIESENPGRDIDVDVYEEADE